MLLAPSPRNVTVRPASVPLCSRIVSRSASSWHGWKSSLSALTTGTRRAGGHLLEPGLRVGAPDDRRHLPLEHARRVGRRLLAAELAVRGRDDQRAAPEIGDPDREAHAGAGRRLVEDHRDGLRAGQRRSAPAVGLDGLGEIEDLGLLGLGQVVVAQEVAGHRAAPSESVTVRQGVGEQSGELGDLGVADDQRRREADAGLARRVDDQSRVERAARDDVAGDRLGQPDAEQQPAALDVGDQRRADPLRSRRATARRARRAFPTRPARSISPSTAFAVAVASGLPPKVDAVLARRGTGRSPPRT